jgi:1-acyl-sn-glycerol-3-phosphate acyltransferase
MSKTLNHSDFIPAKESKLYIFFFKWYCRWLFGRRFHRVWIQQQYQPLGKSTLYILNHHSWWDGLTPLLLNEFRFKQNARAIMEDRQIRQFPFFTRIGAMSISRENMRSAIVTLASASEWLNGNNNSLYLYPEGKITDPCDKITFESGLMRILRDATDCDIVPIAMHFSMSRSDKPELFINVGPKLDRIHHPTLESFESNLQALLNSTKTLSHFENHRFEKMI